jgi:putative hydrolase of HD superfamily
VEKIELHGSQVNLRDWQLTDLKTLAHWLQPGHRWQELDAPYYKSATSNGITDYIARIRARIETGNLSTPRQNLLIAERTHDRMIGQVSRYWISEETHWLAAGLVIYDPALWGQGYGADALRLWTSYLFAAFPEIVRLDLQTWSGNTGMMKLAEKLGFVLEGRFRKARLVNGVHYDALGYGLLREDWETRQPATDGR